MIKCFSMKLNKYQELICCYVLAVPRTLKKIFSRSNSSDNPCRSWARCIPTCSYCIYYCSLSASALLSSLLKVPSVSMPDWIFYDTADKILETENLLSSSFSFGFQSLVRAFRSLNHLTLQIQNSNLILDLTRCRS